MTTFFEKTRNKRITSCCIFWIAFMLYTQFFIQTLLDLLWDLSHAKSWDNKFFLYLNILNTQSCFYVSYFSLKQMYVQSVSHIICKLDLVWYLGEYGSNSFSISTFTFQERLRMVKIIFRLIEIGQESKWFFQLLQFHFSSYNYSNS